MRLAKRVRARLQSYNLFTSVANTNYARQHIRLDTSAGRRTSSWLKKRLGARLHAGGTTRGEAAGAMEPFRSHKSRVFGCVTGSNDIF